MLEGEQIIGLKQNRIVNMSILIKENSELPVPVSCVEEGRWGVDNRRKKPYSDSIASANLRARIKEDLMLREDTVLTKKESGRKFLTIKNMKK